MRAFVAVPLAHIAVVVVVDNTGGIYLGDATRVGSTTGILGSKKSSRVGAYAAGLRVFAYSARNGPATL